MSLNLLKQIIKTNYPDVKKEQMALLEKAYFTAEKKLKGIKRGSMDYFEHPLGSALIIARIKLCPTVVVATLLHDLPHRTDYTLEEINKDFGKEVYLLLNNLQALRGIEKRYKGTEKYVENAKRMFVVVAKDFRVLLIKFAERLNNLQNLETFPLANQKRMVEMAERLYIPLMGILGIWHLRWQMEDICFKYKYPQEYRKIYSKIEKGLYKQREKIIEEVKKKVLKETKGRDIECGVGSRFKHVASINRKMQEKKVRFNELYDVFAVRVTVNKAEDCYTTLGIIHSFWKPVPRRIKDYIAAPKPNSYQSLHTTVFSSDGHYMEFQIRTKEMDDEAKYGVAAHWYYKGSYGSKGFPEWIDGIMEATKIYNKSSQIIDKVNLDALTDNIFCYTPAGDIIELPRGSTPIDLAYKLHSDLGHYCKAVIVNDVERPLDILLKNNDVVEIIKKSTRKPLKTWLKFVKTKEAEDSINRFYNSKIKKVRAG